jgi:ribosomal protein S6--L-glutamate ligase
MGMNLYFMLAFSRSKEPNPVLVELFERLRARGYHVEIGVGSELLLEHAQLAREHDLYILKSHTALWLSLAGILHCQGARMVNPYPSCVAAHDKIAAQRQLEAAGVPVPRSWVTGDLQLLRPLAEERALIVKPYIGGRGVGVVLATNPRELAAIPTPQQPMLIQEYVPGDELKVSVIGETVAGIRKVETADGTVRVPCPISDAVRAIALRCGEVFGLGLYGLDVIEGPRGPVVIDLNYFPSYKGVPGAAALLADYIVGRAAGGATVQATVSVSDDGRRVGVREPVAA